MSHVSGPDPWFWLVLLERRFHPGLREIDCEVRCWIRSSSITWSHPAQFQLIWNYNNSKSKCLVVFHIHHDIWHMKYDIHFLFICQKNHIGKFYLFSWLQSYRYCDLKLQTIKSTIWYHTYMPKSRLLFGVLFQHIKNLARCVQIGQVLWDDGALNKIIYFCKHSFCVRNDLTFFRSARYWRYFSNDPKQSQHLPQSMSTKALVFK